MIVFKSGFKYQLVEDWEGWQLSPEITILKPYTNRYWSISMSGFVRAFAGCGYDGATHYPDRKWVMEPALCHDILCWAIQEGCIPESDNNLIDRELERVALERSPIPMIGGMTWLRIKARIVRRGTNLDYQREGERKPTKIIMRKM